ncbi:MAG TPA: cbb3-type cytochrome c oxidase subunit I [Solirubrobacterales bacterium]|nr:cbb3-type cytochrome c oxidase subunit I [Solirubrobacterales bacterium]
MSRTSSYPQTMPPTRPEVSSGGPAPRDARWISLSTSPDHKDIGRILIAAGFGSLFLAALELLLMRAQLAIPSNVFLPGVTFDRLLSAYGETSIFLIALPLVIGLLYYVVPLQIGSRGTAVPRVGQTGLWLFILGGFLLYGSFLFTPPEAGINPLPPFSDTTFTPNNGVDVWIASTGMVTLGLLLIAIDLLATLHNLRAPGMAWRRAPLFTWAGAIVTWLFAVIAPIFIAAITMLLIDRLYSGGFFSGDEGGSPILWQHFSYLFFTGVYMAISVTFLAAIGEIVQTFTGRQLPRKSFIWSLIAIAVIGTLAWTQNMLTAPIPSGWKYYGMLMGLSLIVPFGLIFYNLITTVSSSDFHMRAPLRYALGALSLASIGLAAEIAQSTIAVATQLSETYDAWAATHFTLIGFVVFGGFAAVSYWYPKLTGHQLNEDRAKKSFGLMFAGTIIAILPLFGAGVEGQVTDSYRFFSGEGAQPWNLIAAVGTLILFVGIVLSVGNLIKSRTEEPVATPDPYRGDSLEWLALSPPPAHNFDVLPDVRSTRPMRDIREAINRRDAEAAEAEGVAQPVA